MTATETAALVAAIISNPLVQLGVTGVVAIGGVLAGYLISTQPKAKDIAQDLADLDAEIGPWVLQAAALFKPGEMKYAQVEGQAKDWLASRGVIGRKGRLAEKYLPAFIEKAVALTPGHVTPKIA
jgi:hypothetical protein